MQIKKAIGRIILNEDKLHVLSTSFCLMIIIKTNNEMK
jgi:hypothetical protein